jgi:hypothetical protein
MYVDAGQEHDGCLMRIPLLMEVLTSYVRSRARDETERQY